MKKTKILVWAVIATVFLTACGGAADKGAVSKKITDAENSIVNEKPAEAAVETSVAAERVVDENFDDFLKQFKDDKKFQLSRLKIAQKNWKLDAAKYIRQGRFKEGGTGFEGSFSKSNNKCVYELGYADSEIFVVITFLKTEGKWMLTKQEFPEMGDED